LTSGFSPQSSPSLRNVSQSVAGPMRDTSRVGLAERREAELLCIRTSERVRPNRGLLLGTTADAVVWGQKDRTGCFHRTPTDRQIWTTASDGVAPSSRPEGPAA
jgi:hypothetical protein